MNRTKKIRLRPAFDALDGRCLLAGGVTAGLSAGVLTINGTNAADVINVNVNARVAKQGRPPAGTVTIGGIRQKFQLQKISQVVINGRDGDDVIALNVRGPAKLRSQIDGGAGADTINGVREFIPQGEPDLPTAPPVTVPTVPSVPVSAIVQRIVDLTNVARQEAGLAPLRISDKLTAAAQHLADDLARLNTLSHSLPTSDAPTLKDRAARVNYRYSWLGENIAYNYATAEAVVAGWMNSAGHRENILNPNFTEIGVGVASNSKGEPYYAQEFGRPFSVDG